MNTKLYYTTPEMERIVLSPESRILSFSNDGQGEATGQGMVRGTEEEF